MRFRHVLMVPLLVGGCVSASPGSGPTTEPLAHYRLDSSDKQAIQDGIKKVLKDPESARFGPLVAGKDPKGLIFVCGTINARNSFGGYVGDRVFIGGLMKVGSARVFRPLGGFSTSIDQTVNVRSCKEYGLI